MTTQIIEGDCLDVLRGLDAASIDAVVTDPPYGLEFMGKEWDKIDTRQPDDPTFHRSGVGPFDRAKVRHSLAPSYGGWQSGGGFSKPGIGDRPTEWASFSATSRFGTANPTCECGGRLRGAKKCTCEEPRWKPIGKRRDPENEGLPDDMTGAGMARQLSAMQEWHYAWACEALRVLKPGGHLLAFGGTRTYHRLACAIEDAGFEIRDSIHWMYGSGFPKSHNLDGAWKGWGTALKPAHEPIVVARKPLIGTVAANVERFGVGALNIDGCRIETLDNLNGGAYSANGAVRHDGTENWRYKRTGEAGAYKAPSGRWPANVILDEDAAAELDAQSGLSTSKAGRPRVGQHGNGWGMTRTGAEYGDNGGASRFFYCAKASRAERELGLDNLTTRTRNRVNPGGLEHEPRWAPTQVKNHHPTVKPITLMRYLVRLVAPSGSTILDPFLGSGTTAIACALENMNCLGIEREPEYVAIARTRVASFTEAQGPLFKE